MIIWNMKHYPTPGPAYSPLCIVITFDKRHGFYLTFYVLYCIPLPEVQIQIV